MAPTTPYCPGYTTLAGTRSGCQHKPRAGRALCQSCHDEAERLRDNQLRDALARIRKPRIRS